MEKAVVSTQEQDKLASSIKDFALAVAGWADDKKAENIFVYEVNELCSYADYLVICSGTSERHVSAIAEELREQGKHAGHMPLGVEGAHKSQWVLLDFGDVVAHIFYEPVREYYDLDRLWPAEARIWAAGVHESEQSDDEGDV